MDIRERVEAAISQHGLTKKEVCDRMGKFDQAFKSLLTNPKWSTLEKVTEAIGIEPWQLFEQEIMAAGYRLVAAPQPEPAAVAEEEKTDETVNDNQGQQSGGEASAEDATTTEQEGAAADAPSDAPSQQAEQVRAVRFTYECPKCGERISVTIE